MTNDIFTKEDGEFLVRHQALEPSESAPSKPAAARMPPSAKTSPRTCSPWKTCTNGFTPDLLLIESGGDNLAAHFSRELADYSIYVIDVAGGDKVPRKGGPGITQSDLLVINKTRSGDSRRRRSGRDGSRRPGHARPGSVCIRSSEERNRRTDIIENVLHARTAANRVDAVNPALADEKNGAISFGFCRTQGRSLLSPLPVLRERVRVRVFRRAEERPSPRPLPEYRERQMVESRLTKCNGRTMHKRTAFYGIFIIPAFACRRRWLDDE